MAGFFIIPSHDLRSLNNGIFGNYIGAIFQLIGHNNITQVYHEVRLIFQLVQQATIINCGIRLAVEVWISLYNKDESFSYRTLRVKFVFRTIVYLVVDF